MLLDTPTGRPDGKTVLRHHKGIMQQPKLFYPQHETYAPRPLDRPDGQPNRPFPAFVLPENLASVGFHMAPCGCFFDPRIYRIEWATANFVQPSIYKLSGGPGPQNAYLLDSQKYLKGPLQPVPYPAYQPVVNNPPFVLPFFKPEGPASNLTDHINFLGNPLHGSPFVDAPQLHSEGLGPSKDRQLLATVPDLNLKEQPAPVGNYDQLKGELHHCHDLAFQAFKGFPVEDEDFKDHDATQEFVANPSVSNVHPGDQTPLGVPEIQELEPCVPESIITNESQLLEEQESFNLPEKVLLEDAMKLFDCSPVNSDTEASLDELSNGAPCRGQGEGPKDSCFSGKDSPSDIRSLNLPDELLSFDYSVPEILSAVTSLDYLYDVNTFVEETQWENRPSAQLLPKQESHLEPEEKVKDSVGAAKKGQGMGSKPKLSSTQGGDGEPQQPEPAVLGV
ncbi:proline-rich protein 22 isoform X2 [Hemicordylus capensis]|uniref:proline-rich protein 22 isoform X2 n=1 Tax=Hemicordylus capensis TaxID=884348 RepID=UPI002303943C|nr:proline-rich protein 22 isoform X2 [Hemicordylus capensis]